VSYQTPPPAGDPYAQPYGQPYGQPFGAPQVPQTNGLATAGLVLGILPTGIIGLVFSILGLRRAGQIGGVGRGKAVTGLIFSILWTLVYVAVTIAFAIGVKDGVKQAVSCQQMERNVQTIANRLQTDSANPETFKADLQQIIDELNRGANTVGDTKSAADMRKAAADYQELLTDLNSGTLPPTDLTTRLTTDGQAVDEDCA
jgi:hypothetical protein